MELEVNQKFYIIRKEWISAQYDTYSVMGLEITKINKKSYTAANLRPKNFEKPVYNLVVTDEKEIALTFNSRKYKIFDTFEEALKNSKDLHYNDKKEKLELEKEAIEIRLEELTKKKAIVEEKLKDLEG